MCLLLRLARGKRERGGEDKGGKGRKDERGRKGTDCKWEKEEGERQTAGKDRGGKVARGKEEEGGKGASLNQEEGDDAMNNFTMFEATGKQAANPSLF